MRRSWSGRPSRGGFGTVVLVLAADCQAPATEENSSPAAAPEHSPVENVASALEDPEAPNSGNRWWTWTD